ncbi:hypothetical protein ACHAWF_003453 [Thalassiosira exigua]
MLSSLTNAATADAHYERLEPEATYDQAVTRWNYVYALCAALNSVNLGYDIGVTTDVGLSVTKYFDLSVPQREFFTAGIDLFAIFGGMLSYVMSDRYGRKANFTGSAILFILGIVIQCVAPNYGVLLLGRAILGFAVGIGFAVDPVYIAEISPKDKRGFFVSFSEIGTNVGIVFGFASSLIFASVEESARWRVMTSMGAIAPVIMLFLATCVMPESPRWYVPRFFSKAQFPHFSHVSFMSLFCRRLIANNREDEARQVLKKIYKDERAVDPIAKDIEIEVEFDREASKHGWSLVLRPSPAVTRMLLVGIGAGVSQQAIGVDAIQYYLNTVLIEAGIPEGTTLNWILLGLMITKLVCTTTGGYLFDVLGRRPLFFVSLIGCTAGMVTLSAAFFVNSDQPNNATVIAGIIVYIVFFSFAVGPGSWLIPSEVFVTSIRAKAFSLMTALNRLIAFLFDMTFISTATAMGWGPFYLMLGVICLVVLAYLYILLPETKDKSLEEMNVYFAEVTGDNTTLEREKELHQRAVQNRAEWAALFSENR